MESETVAGTVATYNVGNAADAGWHYGFVALKKDGTRVYSDRNTEPTGVASFTLPANTENYTLSYWVLPSNTSLIHGMRKKRTMSNGLTK